MPKIMLNDIEYTSSVQSDNTYEAQNIVYDNENSKLNSTNVNDAIDEINNNLNSKSDANHTHDDRYYTESEVNTKLNGKSNTGHTHDDRYYTESEVNAKLNGKSNTGHTHDDRYYTESEVNNLLSGKVSTYTDNNFYKINSFITFKDTNNALINGAKGNYIFGISAWSDIRLKENIEKTNVNGIDTINQIQLYSYDFKDKKFGTHQNIGYIANELKEIIPEAVISVPQNEKDMGYSELYQVEDSVLIKYLVKSVQELSAKIKKIEEKN